MSRNANRTKAPSPPPKQPLTYSPPTTHVSLPSGGKFYPLEHALHGEDKNAMLVALRIDAYGEDYQVSIPCPICGETNEKQIDLSILEHKGLGEDVVTTERGTFEVELPRTGATVELRLLTGNDEKKIAETNKKTKKYGLERPIATQYSHMVSAVNGETEYTAISAFVSTLPAFDSRVIRNAYKKLNPDVDMSFDFQCDVCSHEQGMEVPITANFFWSD